MTPKNKKVKRWFYIDNRKALDPSIDREEVVVGVPEDRVIRTDFDRKIVLDLSAPENEYALLMFPLAQVFDWDKWQDGFDKYWRGDQHGNTREQFRSFKRQVLENFKYDRVASYQFGPLDLERSSVRSVREGQHRRKTTGCFRAGHRYICCGRARATERLVRG